MNQLPKFSILVLLTLCSISLVSSLPAKPTDEIRVPIRAFDFRDAKYLNNDDCALARACKRRFQLKDFSVGTNQGHSYSDRIIVEYKFSEEYGPGKFDFDEWVAWFRGYDSSVVRVIPMRITKIY